MIETIIKKLQVLEPSILEVIDESYLHKGHGGFREGEVTHIRIEIKAESLSALSRVEQHRRIYGLLADEMNGSLHAVTLMNGD